MGWLKKAKNLAGKAPGMKQAMGLGKKTLGMGMDKGQQLMSGGMGAMSAAKKPALLSTTIGKNLAGGAAKKAVPAVSKLNVAKNITSPEKIAAGVSEKMKSGMGKGLALGKAMAPGQAKKAGGNRLTGFVSGKAPNSGGGALIGTLGGDKLKEMSEKAKGGMSTYGGYFSGGDLKPMGTRALGGRKLRKPSV